MNNEILILQPFSLFRKERRKHSKPLKLEEIDENAEFIKLFLKKVRFGGETSTKRKIIGHLFSYHDSYLAFNTKKIPDFNLKRHLEFLSEKFLELKDPTVVDGWFDWVTEISGKDEPGRLRQKLNAFTALLKFLVEEFNNQNFEFSVESYLKRDMCLKHIQNIRDQISEKKIFQQLNSKEDDQRLEKQKAKNLLEPSQNHNERNIVKNWFESDEAKQIDKECMEIYDEFKAGAEIGEKKFVKFAITTRFTCAVIDGNRTSSYGYSNYEFYERRPKWLPDFDTGDSTIEDRFRMIPDDWDPNVPHEIGQKPTCWVITVSGKTKSSNTKGLKRGKAVEVVLTEKCMDMCLMYKDLKTKYIGDVKGEDPFFVNMKGKPLAPIKRTKGSLLDKMATACGVSNPTVNSFRRSNESRIQLSP